MRNTVKYYLLNGDDVENSEKRLLESFKEWLGSNRQSWAYSLSRVRFEENFDAAIAIYGKRDRYTQYTMTGQTYSHLGPYKLSFKCKDFLIRKGLNIEGAINITIAGRKIPLFNALIDTVDFDPIYKAYSMTGSLIFK